MSIYDYNELREKAIAPTATQKDLENLWNWFDQYGNRYWNGECYNVDGYLLFPVYNMEPDEFDSFEITGYELQTC